MAALSMTHETYRSKVYGGWLGKQIGVTLGMPYDGKVETREVRFYDPIPGQPAASDDVDFQIVWLHALREHGIDVTTDDLAAEWLDHITYPWDEYGWAAYNLRRDLRPPISGAFNNWFRQSAGAAGRTEVWALIAPGAPQIAAAYAYRDAIIDHAGEGVWAAMFWAAVQSAAFFVSDSRTLLDVGLAMVPQNSRIARAVRLARDARAEGVTLGEARGRILQAVGDANVTDVAQNLGFTVLGWLYGGGAFAPSLTAVVNCGHGTASNAGTLGALLGILAGRDGLPVDWVKPIGDSVVIGWGLEGLDAERTLAELAAHTAEVGERVVAARCPDVAIVEEELTLELEATPQSGPGASAETAAVPPTVEPPAPAEAGAEEALAAVAEPVAPADAGADGAPVAATEPAGDAPPAAAAPPPMAPPAAAALPPLAPAVNWTENDAGRPLLVAPACTSECGVGPFEVVVDYGDTGPTIVPNQATSFTTTIRNTGASEFVGHVNVSVPPGWQVAVPGAQGQRQILAPGGMARYGFVVRAPDSAAVAPRNVVTLVLRPEKAPSLTCDVPLLGGSCWWFVGPFQNFVDEGFYKAFGPEDNPDMKATYLSRAGGLIGWERMAFRENVMEVEPVFAGSAGVAYGVTTVHLPTPVDARLLIHTNDGVVAWVNGQKVVQWHSHDPFRPTLAEAPAAAPVKLRAGDNRVMLKVVRCGEPARLCFAVTDADGRPLAEAASTRW